MTDGATPLPVLRSGLEFSSQQHLGKNYLVVKDPITKRYFRFTETQGVILDFLHEPIDGNTLVERISEKLGANISLKTIEAFIASLEEKFLVDTEKVRERLATLESQKLNNNRNLFYWKLASINPERIFNWLLPRTRWAFTGWFQIFAVLTIATGLTINLLHWDDLAVSAASLFSLHGLVLIWLVTFTVVTIHEFSHGLTCCHFGGKVQEVGFMLIYFQPAFYCDVSDSWMFPSKKNRMLVTLAGGYIQLVVWGLCTILWRITDPDTVISQLTLVVIVFAGIQTVVNFNPLIKLDGYYMLSDYLEIPNLRAKAMDTLWRFLGRPLGKRPPWREERAQLIYGIAALVFSTTLLIYVFSALYTWATGQFAFAGLVGFVMFSTYTLRGTAAESIAGLRAVAAKPTFRRYRNAGIVLAILFISIVVHWELKIGAEFTVIPHGDMAVRPETSGVIVDILVHEGSHVAKGEVIARLRDFDKQQKVSELAGDLEQKKSELALLKAGASKQEIDTKQKEVETKRVELSNARRNQEQRNQLQQSLEGKRSALQLDQQTLKRDQELVDSGLIARAEFDKAQTQVQVREREVSEVEASMRALTETGDRESDLKSRELAQAESDLSLTEAGSRPQEIAEREAEVTKLEQQVKILDDELTKTEIRSPIDGVVATPFIERKLNEYLAAGDELCRIVDVSSVTAEMLVPEKEMADVHLGNPVWMKMRSFPSKDFEGRVDFISPVAETVNAQQMMVVRSELPNKDSLLRPDMTGVANIYCGQRRLIDLATRRLVRWIRTEFWTLLP